MPYAIKQGMGGWDRNRQRREFTAALEMRKRASKEPGGLCVLVFLGATPPKTKTPEIQIQTPRDMCRAVALHRV